MGRTARRWTLFAHIVSSVGWLGVEAAMLALGVLGILASDPAVVTSAYLIAGELGAIFYFPASLLALTSGVLLGIGTKWGLLRYYWVAAKLVINIALFLGGNLLVIPEFVAASAAAANGARIGDTRIMLLSAMTAGVTLLLVATLLSTFTPWGKTRMHPARR